MATNARRRRGPRPVSARGDKQVMSTLLTTLSNRTMTAVARKENARKRRTTLRVTGASVGDIGPLPILSVQFSGTPTRRTHPEREGPRAEVFDVEVTRTPDANTAKFMELGLRGDQLPTVIISVPNGDKDTMITLTNVIIANVSADGDTETLVLNFESISFTEGDASTVPADS